MLNTEAYVSTEVFAVKLGSRNAPGYLIPAAFGLVKAHQQVRIKVAKSGERGYTDLILTATQDAYEQPQASDASIFVIEGVTMHPRVAGRVVLKYIPAHDIATLTPTAAE